MGPFSGLRGQALRAPRSERRFFLRPRSDRSNSTGLVRASRTSGPMAESCEWPWEACHPDRVSLCGPHPDHFHAEKRGPSEFGLVQFQKKVTHPSLLQPSFKSIKGGIVGTSELARAKDFVLKDFTKLATSFSFKPLHGRAAASATAVAPAHA